MNELAIALNEHFASWLDFPQNSSDLSTMLGKKWLDLRDPWGSPYYAEFSIEGQNLIIRIWSNGPDKKPKTKDDFIAGTIYHEYFKIYKHLIQEALNKQDYPATYPEFLDILHKNGILFEALRDPWGSPYQVEIDTINSSRIINIRSAGPDHELKTEDDVYIVSFWGKYFSKKTKEISEALDKAGFIPQTTEDFLKILSTAGINLSQIPGAWGRPYKVLSAVSSSYDDKIRYKTVQVYGGPAELQTELIPITKTYITFSIHSDGPDLTNTWEAFNVASFPFLLKEESRQTDILQTASLPEPLSGTGRISGTVRDQTGAVILRAVVTLIQNEAILYKTETDEIGAFLIPSLPEGTYSLRVTRMDLWIAML